MCSRLSLREKSPYSEFVLSKFFAFGLNADQKNSKHGHIHAVCLNCVGRIKNLGSLWLML